MSRDLILAEIARGPKTVAQLLDVVQGSSGYVSAACQRLVKAGKIKRVDGNTGPGPGAYAVYAPLDFHGTVETKRVNRIHFPVGRDPEHPGHIVHRDPCFYCGARGDIPCKHDRRLS